MTIDSGRTELVWANLAKAACILLVVMMHCGDHLIGLPWVHKEQIASGWVTVNSFLRPLRMPLFFLVSGLLASNSMIHPRGNTQANRLVKPIYLYVAWGVIYQVFIPLNANPSWFAPSIDNSFLPIVMVMMMSWYLAALAIYYLFVRVTAKLPVEAVLLLAAGLSVLGTVCEGSLMDNQAKILRCVIFFTAGVRMKEQVLAFVEGATVRRAAVLCLGYVAGAMVCVERNTFLLPVDIVAVALGATICMLAARNLAALKAPATWLAKRTLPIYVIHFLLIRWLGNAVEAWGTPMLGSFWAGAAYPILVAPIIVAGSLAVHAVLVRMNGQWLFELPALASPLARAVPRSKAARLT